MSRPNPVDDNIPNGIVHQTSKSNLRPQETFTHKLPLNGLGSEHSSRDPSPGTQFKQVPVSQLPPVRTSIPASQLPPSRIQNPTVNLLTQNYNHLSVSTNISTPNLSPKIQAFGTSTPVVESTNNEVKNSQRNTVNSFGQSSPIRISEKSEIIQNAASTFTHSASSQFTNVPTTTVLGNEFQNVSNKSQNVSSDFLMLGKTDQLPNVVPPRNQMSVQSRQLPGPSYLASQMQPLRKAVTSQQNVPNQVQSSTLQSHFPHNNVNNCQSISENHNLHSNLPSYGGSAPNLYQRPLQSTSSTISNTSTGPPMTPCESSNMPPHLGSFPPQASNVQRQFPRNPSNQYQGIKSFHSRYPTLQQNEISHPSQPTSQYQSIQASQTIPQNQNFQPPQPVPLNQNLSQGANYYQNQSRQPTQFGQQMSVTQAGFNKLWGAENFDLLQCPNILPPTKVESPKISLGQEYLDAANCNRDIFQCTMTKIPETNSLLQKSRLPLGVLIHPFKDLNHLPVIQCNTIVRCRACRTYINPFVFFVDAKRWKCNLCYRVNELPEEFQYDPVSKTYGDPSRRPEIKASTIEYIAPSEYMLRPPQPAVYLFLLDVSRAAVESGYLNTFSSVLTEQLTSLPGDLRTHIGFLAYNSALHFYALGEGLSQPHELTVLDINDVFLPCPDNLLVNLKERTELVSELLNQLPTRFNSSYDTGSALGAALQAAHKLMSSTGGRVTVFQAALPTLGPGALTAREDPNQRAATEAQHLNPANDFYKRLALECSGQQIAVDLFIINSQYADIATLSGISRFSGGSIYHFPLYKASRVLENDKLKRTFRRYLTRKIGFEAVMRIRCTRGLSIHTFHGNFFVRSTDLLSLPNVNPDAGFGMQVSIEENLSDLQTVCFQAALLYTSSKGERRIRVHTLCVPIASTLSDIINSADQQCIIGLLSKMAVDRSLQSSLSDARDAFINVAIDILSSYKLLLNMGSGISGLLAPQCLKLLPLYICALLKHASFRTGTSTRLDDRVKAMCDMKTLPLPQLIQQVYADLYAVHDLEHQNTVINDEGEPVPQPPRLQLSARSLDSKGAFLLDICDHMVLFVCEAVSNTFLNQALGVSDYSAISDQMYELPLLENPCNQRLHSFINCLNDEKPFTATLQVIRDNSPCRTVFLEHLIEDRIETALSYHEFLQHLKTQVK